MLQSFVDARLSRQSTAHCLLWQSIDLLDQASRLSNGSFGPVHDKVTTCPPNPASPPSFPTQLQGPAAAQAAAAVAETTAQPLTSNSRKCRVAVGQMTSVGDQLKNFQTCKNLADQAAAAGCKILFLPECFSFIGESQQEVSVH